MTVTIPEEGYSDIAVLLFSDIHVLGHVPGAKGVSTAPRDSIAATIKPPQGWKKGSGLSRTNGEISGRIRRDPNE